MTNFAAPTPSPEYDRTFAPQMSGTPLLPNMEQNPCREMPVNIAQPYDAASIGPQNQSGSIAVSSYAPKAPAQAKPV